MNKKRIAVIIVIVVIVAAAFWIVRTPAETHEPSGSAVTREHSTDETQEQTSVTLSYDEWLDILLYAMDCSEENGDSKWYVDDDGHMVVEGDLSKATVEQWMSDAGQLDGLYKSVLALLPDELPMTLTSDVSCEDGKVSLDFVSLKAGDIDVPEELVSGSVWDGVNEKLNDSLSEKTDSISDIKIDGDSVALYQ